MAEWQKKGHWLPMSKAGSWFFSKTMRHFDRFVFRLTGGKVMLTEFFTGVPSIMVTARGAKSGELRTSPLLGIPDGENWIVIASNWGQKHHPAWYYNLKTHPEVTVAYHGQSRTMAARMVTGEEREACWQKALTYYKVYYVYKARAGREIPVFRVEGKG